MIKRSNPYNVHTWNMIPLYNGYFVMDDPSYIYALRHRCTNDYLYGQPVVKGHCHGCKVETPDKVLFMYKLWMFHNETGG